MSDTTIGRLEACLLRLQNGEKGAARELVELAYERLRALAHQIFGATDPMRRIMDPTDVVNASFVRMIKALEESKPATVGDFLGLAGSKIRQQLIDEARHHWGRGAKRPKTVVDPTLLGVLSGRSESPSGAAIQEQLLEAVWQKAQAFTPEDRRMLYLLSYRRLPQEQVAELLDVDEATVKRKWRAVKLKLFDVVEACLIGQKLPDLDPKQRVAAFRVVEDELLQRLWVDLDELTKSLPPDEARLVDLIWVWGFSETDAADVLNESEASVKTQWAEIEKKFPPALRDMFRV